MKNTIKAALTLAVAPLVAGFGFAAIAHAGPPTSVAVKVTDKGFEPPTVTLAKGSGVTLVFTRTTDATCAKEVAFPELKLKKELPLNTPVTIAVPTDAARTLAFTCGMGMYKSSVVVQ
jgi:plastocyanin domain-containing protein